MITITNCGPSIAIAMDIPAIENGETELSITPLIAKKSLCFSIGIVLWKKLLLWILNNEREHPITKLPIAPIIKSCDNPISNIPIEHSKNEKTIKNLLLFTPVLANI